MTHKVAGPLFKVSLYLAKMRDGRSTRSGTSARATSSSTSTTTSRRRTQASCRWRRTTSSAQGVIAAAEEAGAGEHETVVELRDVLARKEKALE